MENLPLNGRNFLELALLAGGASAPAGNSNNLSGPGGNNWDIGFDKFFPLMGEHKRLEFRAEMFNAFNHAQFGQPNNNVADGLNFGRVSSASAPRLIQMSMKLLF